MGRALSFAGEENQKATFISPAMTNCTVAFWCRRGENDGPYVEENNTTSPYLFASWGSIRCHISHGNRSLAFIGVENTALASLSDVIPPAIWMHDVVTFRETERTESQSTMETKVYVDGALLSTTVKTMPGLQGTSRTSTTWLGNFTTGVRPPMFRMDEFRAWDRVLTEEEAIAEYMRTAEHAPPSLVAYWDMDEIQTEGGTPYARDKSGLGHTLTLGTAVTVTNEAVEGQAFAFVNDANSWGRATFNVSLSATTFALWIKPAADSSATSPRIFDGFYGGYVHASSARTAYDLTVKEPTGTAFTFSGANEPWCLDKGQWTHLTLVRRPVRQGNGTYAVDIEMYVNGVKRAERTGIAVTSPFFDTTRSLYFFSNGSSRPIDALGDELRVYKGAMTAAQVAKLYAGAPTVSAGTDFTVAADTATLHGYVGTDAADVFRSGYSGKVAWSLVSCPEGGEGAAFVRPANAETEVTLPVVGTYVFRLSVTSEGFVRSDDVTVTRTASATGPLPTVTASAQASVTLPLKGWLKAESSGADSIWWSKVSGPGGVWFDVDAEGNGYVFFSDAGSYTLSLHGANAVGTVSSEVSVTVSSDGTAELPKDNLQLHYSFNTNEVWVESIRSFDFSSQLTTWGGTRAALVPGAKVLGVRVLPSNESLRYDQTWETRNTSNGNLITWPDFLTFSAWIKYEPDTDTNGSELPFIFLNHQSACLRMGRATGKNATGIVDGGDGMTICQQGQSGVHVGMLCDFDGIPSITGRWTHVCAIFPRTGGEQSNFELWIDGVKRNLTAQPSFAGNFPRPARDQRNPWEIGGRYALITSNYGLFAHATNRVDGGYKSATFPGAIDEVRFYSTRLTAAQIRALANEMDASRNFAPAIDTPVSLRMKRRSDTPLSLGVYDDGKPANGTLASSWKVISGDKAAVSFADEVASSTTVRFNAAGNYKLQLVATDGERTSYSDPVDVEVLPVGTVISFR